MTATPHHPLDDPADGVVLDLDAITGLARGGFFVLFQAPFGRADGSRAAAAHADGYVDALDRIGFQGMGNGFAIRCAFLDMRARFASTMADARSPREHQRVQERAIDAVVNRLLSNTTEDFPHGILADGNPPDGCGYAILPPPPPVYIQDRHAT